MKRRMRRISIGGAPAAIAMTVLLAGALAGWFFLSAESGHAAPPLSGWMQNFSLTPPGTRAPDVRFSDRDQTTYTLEDFRGKVVLVNFWATWCGPCIRELPSLQRLQARLGGPKFTVLALSQDRGGWKRIAPFWAERGLGTLPVFHDARGALSRAAGVRGLPTSVLYAADGEEIGRLSGHADWDSDEAVALISHYLGD